MCKKCWKCGASFEDEFDIRTINPGMSESKQVCEFCLGEMENAGEVIRCDACGEVWSTDMLHDEALDDTHTFTPCPACHKDVVDCLTREEMLEEIAPLRFSVILCFVNGRDRGYIVHADNRADAVEKVIKTMRARDDVHGIASISVSEILLKEDEIR